MAYLDRMLHSQGKWVRSDSDLFARRCIEVGKIKGVEQLTVTFLDQAAGQQFLRSRYPGLALGEEFTDLPSLAREMNRLFPHLAVSRPPLSHPFHGQSSPAALLETLTTKSSWKSVVRILKEGARWEAKYPELDYGLGSNAPIMSVFSRHLKKGVHLGANSRGLSVRSLFRAVAQ